MTVAAAIGAATVGRELIVDVFGGEFRQSGAVLAVMAIALVPTSLNMICHRILVAMNRQAIWTWVMLGALAVKVCLDLALIPALDALAGNPALGATIALAAAETAMMVVALKMLPAGILSGGLGRHAFRLGLVAATTMAVAFAMESRGPLVAGLASAGTFALLALSSGTYTAGELVQAARLAAGRGAAEAVVAMGRPIPVVVPLMWEDARMKANRPAPSEFRRLWVVHGGGRGLPVDG
jgi:O-antigen/teichoic acid export membrane protein